MGGKESAPHLLERGIKAKALAVLLERDAGREPKSASLGCLHHCVLWLSDSHPLLHGAFTVQYVSWRTLPLELKDGVDQHQQAERQDAWYDDSDGFDRAGFIVQFNHDVLVIRRLHVGVDGREVASHEVFQDRARIAGLHPQPVVVELPVFFTLVEVRETCNTGDICKMVLYLYWIFNSCSFPPMFTFLITFAFV